MSFRVPEVTVNLGLYLRVAVTLLALGVFGCAGKPPPPPPPPTPEAKVAAATAAAAAAKPVAKPATTAPPISAPPPAAPPVAKAKPDPAATPTQVEIEFVADKDLNPDSKGRASPVVLRVYELRALKSFNDADFFEIFGSEAKALGSDLVARHDIQVTPIPAPGQTPHIRLSPLKSETRFLGVFAEFQSRTGRWRAATAVPLNQMSRMQIDVKRHEVSISLQ
jgi:type VI secretion system protein VasD